MADFWTEDVFYLSSNQKPASGYWDLSDLAPITVKIQLRPTIIPSLTEQVDARETE